mgnify:CR=1 FL=1
MNIYSLDGYDNYFYGYMAPSTGYISAFLVSAYQHGVVLQIPKRKQTEEIVPLHHSQNFPCNAAFQRMDEDDGC